MKDAKSIPYPALRAHECSSHTALTWPAAPLSRSRERGTWRGERKERIL